MENRKTLVIRNYINNEVLDKTPIQGFEILNICGDNGFYGKSLLEKIFIKDRLQDKYEYIVFVDEDCLVYNEYLILSIINDMDSANYDICGMPDGGASCVRFHRSDVPNLFFTIFKCEKIKLIDENNYRLYKIPCNIYENTNTVKCDTFEPYYKILCYFRYAIGMQYLPLSDVYDDKNTGATLLKYNNENLCLHTWYSRKYSKDDLVRKRIDSILDNANAGKNNTITFIMPNRGGEHINDVIQNFTLTFNNQFSDVKFIVIEQCDDNLFMRGQLYNVAVNFCYSEYIALIDNDIYNFDSFNIIETYKKFDSPYLAFDKISQIKLEKNNTYKILKTEPRFGHGAFSVLKRSDFLVHNGFSNLCFGWGAEDNVFNDRVRFKRMKHTLGHISHPKRDNLNPASTENNLKILRLHEGKRILPDKDGFKQTTYTIDYQKIDGNVMYLGVKNISVTKDYFYRTEYNNATKIAGFNIDVAKQKENNIVVNNTKVIYTCVTGNYDTIVSPSYIDKNFDYVCFTDNLNQESGVWKLRPIPDELKNLTPVKQQRVIKVCPHKYLPEYEESFWIDGSIDILASIDELIKTYCNKNDKSVFIRKHDKRQCIYSEAQACISIKKDTKENIERQISRYKQEGFPKNFGLVETGFIYRKHNDDYCKKLMDLWASEIINGSHRDQLSFNYALWKIGNNGFEYLPYSLLRSSKYFKLYPHGLKKKLSTSGTQASSGVKKKLSTSGTQASSGVKANQDKKTVQVNHNLPVYIREQQGKKLNIPIKQNNISQQISGAFGLPLNRTTKSPSYTPVKYETKRSNIVLKTTNKVSEYRKPIDKPKEIKIKNKPIVKQYEQQQQLVKNDTPKQTVYVNPTTLRNQKTNITVPKQEKPVEEKKPQVILKQDTRVLSRRFDNVSKRKMERANRQEIVKNTRNTGGFFR